MLLIKALTDIQEVVENKLFFTETLRTNSKWKKSKNIAMYEIVVDFVP